MGRRTREVELSLPVGNETLTAWDDDLEVAIEVRVFPISIASTIVLSILAFRDSTSSINRDIGLATSVKLSVREAARRG
jgi:hypothetical protein